MMYRRYDLFLVRERHIWTEISRIAAKAKEWTATFWYSVLELVNPNLARDAQQEEWEADDFETAKNNGKIIPYKQKFEKGGSSAARILDLYGNSVLRIAYSYLHNFSDAEDILQETLIRCLQTSPTFENSAHEKAWLLKVAANLSKNRIEYNRIRDTDELNDELIAEEREDLSFVWEAVKELPQKYREAIHLFYYEGYSTAQIAEILNRKESSVRSDLKRGRERLKIILKEAYDFE